MSYLDTLQRAIIYIEECFGENITVEEVAHTTGYSYYHLTRQFQAVLGESIGSYLKSRRLAKMAKWFIYSGQRIIGITMKYGFKSSEAFSRAFKAVYRMGPSVYRKNHPDLIISSREKLDEELIRRRTVSITIHPKLVELPDIKAAGLWGRATLQDNMIPKLRQELMAVRNKTPHPKTDGLGFGIYETCREDDSLLIINGDILFSEVAGIEVDPFEDLPEPFVTKTLKGERYAVFTHKGSLGSLKKTSNYTWRTWVFNTKGLLDDREGLEGYDECFLGSDNSDPEMDIYTPIRQMVDR